MKKIFLFSLTVVLILTFLGCKRSESEGPIASQTPIQLIQPNGGENWIIGTIDTIKWISINVTDVKIDYSTNGGTDWISPAIINSTPASVGKFAWTIPNTPSNNCKVRISDVSNSKVNDLSDNLFAISENYFPNNEGTFYIYSYSSSDSTGLQQGTRFSRYNGTSTIQGTPYKIQIDSLLIAASLQVDSSYFRTTASGVYYFIDTTGFAASITDPSLIPLIPYVAIDNELLAYSLPLLAGRNWPVFKINLTVPIFVTVVDISALAVGKESITLNLLSGQKNKEALKIKYTLTLRLNPLSPATQTFTANAWLISGIGPAKWYGSGTIVNFFTGLGIDFGDTTTVVSQSLIDYNIK